MAFDASSATEAVRTSDRIEDELRRRIITLQLPPGTELDERLLAKQFDCSRTPVHEALQRLAQDQLVIDVPRRGFRVAELSLTAFGEFIAAALAFEGASVHVAAQSITDSEIAELETILGAAERAVQLGDTDTEVRLDFEFHCGIARATRNRYILDTISRLVRQVARYSYLGLNRRGDASSSVAEHRSILEALRTRDPEASRQKVHEHIQKGRDRILRAL